MRLWVRNRWSRRSIAADYSVPRPFGKPCAAALDGIVLDWSDAESATTDYSERRSRSERFTADHADYTGRSLEKCSKNRGFSRLFSGLPPSRKALAKQDGVATPARCITGTIAASGETAATASEISK
jgi:hypothetical protein